MKIVVGQIYLLNESWLDEFFEGDLATISGVDEGGVSGNIGKGLCINKWHVDHGLATLAASAPDADGWREWYRVTDKVPVEGDVTVMLEFRNGVKIKTKKGDMYPWIDITSGICRYKVIAKASDSSEDVVVEDVYGGALMEPKERDNKYQVEIAKGVWVDVYSVLVAFGVTNPADAHAIKKMLMPGRRGVKGSIQDREEAISSIKRAIELERESDELV